MHLIRDAELPQDVGSLLHDRKVEKKTLVYALNQILGGGIARTGQAQAVLIIVIAVPITIFMFTESQILETMASSGLKD